MSNTILVIDVDITQDTLENVLPTLNQFAKLEWRMFIILKDNNQSFVDYIHKISFSHCITCIQKSNFDINTLHTNFEINKTRVFYISNSFANVDIMKCIGHPNSFMCQNDSNEFINIFDRILYHECILKYYMETSNVWYEYKNEKFVNVGNSI